MKKRKGKDKIDIVFLHSSPNLYRRQDVDKIEQLQPLNFLAESKAIKAALDKSEKAVTFQAKVANKVNWNHTITRNKPLILHLSSHGVKKK